MHYSKKQKTLPKSGAAAVTSAELIAKKKELEKMCNQILSKPKPAPPPKEEEKKEQEPPKQETTNNGTKATESAPEPATKEAPVDDQGDTKMSTNEVD
jgi:hypothetical protein